MWELDHKEDWAPKNGCFRMLYYRRFLRILWTARSSNQSILKEINPEYSLEGLMLKLKLQYFGHLMERADSLEKLWCWERLKAGEEGDDRGCDGWMASPTQWTWVWASSRRCWRTRKPVVLQSIQSQRVTTLKEQSFSHKQSYSERNTWQIAFLDSKSLSFRLEWVWLSLTLYPF